MTYLDSVGGEKVPYRGEGGGTYPLRSMIFWPAARSSPSGET